MPSCGASSGSSSGNVTRRVRVALVGCGRIGQVHARRLADDGRAQLTVLIDPDREATESVARQFAPHAVPLTELPALFACDSVDAVVLCTPTGQHFEQVRTLRQHGWPVLCEKPLADSRERIVQLIDEAQTGPLLCLAYQRRCWATFRTLRREVQSGRWGALRAITLSAMERWQPTISGTWRDDPLQNPGGFLGDAGSHKLDMLFYLTGLRPSAKTPLEITATTECRGSAVNIVAAANGRLGPIALSLSFVGDAQQALEDFHLHCENADLLLREGTVWIARDNHAEPMTNLEPESDPDQAFLDCLLDGAENFAPADCALPVWELTQAILRQGAR